MDTAARDTTFLDADAFLRTDQREFGNAWRYELVRGRIVAHAAPSPEHAVILGNLGGELIGDDLGGALLLLAPCLQRQCDPEGAAIHIEADIDGICVAGRNGYQSALPAAVEVFAAPAVGYVEIFVHATRVSSRRGESKGRAQIAANVGAKPTLATKTETWRGWGTPRFKPL